MIKTARILVVGLFLCVVCFGIVTTAFGQAPTATPTPDPASIQLQFAPGEPNWQEDAEVTQVGRNAERARQLIYWVVTHPALYNATAIGQAWRFTMFVSLTLMIFVVIGLAIQLVISSRSIGRTFSGISLGMERINLMNIIVRVVLLLIFVFFSYSLVRLLIEGAEIMSRFFIENLGGQDLFNIIYSGGNTEANYNFIGFRNFDPREQDMATTSLFLVRFTSFTYNFMSVIIILRQIVLLFLLIVSPFLALLLPFIFVRNTGSIWIGEFLRWLFYGPLFALFLSALAKIWKAGIPYTFDFARAKAGDMVYPTAINILYGGPAQTLTPTNTSNYVDTYAEYIIGLVMLWVAILLPWLLLRIFRDYCCDILERNQAILTQILDRLRNFTSTPPVPLIPGPTSSFGKKIDLPYRTSISEKKSVSETMTKEKIIERIREREISSVETRDIQRAFNLQVSSLKDIARIETRKDTASSIRSTLERIQNPMKVSDYVNREAFEGLRSEFTKRAATGDQAARSVIQAATSNVSQLNQVTNNVSANELRQAIAEPGVPVILPQTRIPSEHVVTPAITRSISEKTNVSPEKVEQVLKAIPLAGAKTEAEKVAVITQKTGVPQEQVKNVLDNLPPAMPTTKPAGPGPITIEEYEEVRRMWMNHYRNSDVPVSGTIKSRTDWIQEDLKQLTNTINLLTSPSVKDRQQGMENVSSLLPFLLLGGFTDLETLSYIKAKLEAARLVSEEMEHVEKATEEVKKEQEELVSIPVIEKQEEKEMDLTEQQAMPIPEDETLPGFHEEPEEQTAPSSQPNIIQDDQQPKLPEDKNQNKE